MALYRQILNLFSKPRRGRRSYQGAGVNRLTQNWLTSSTNADSEIRGSLRTLRNRARQLCRDNDYARQALRIVVNNVVGSGIQFQSQVKMARGAGRLDQRINNLIESAWHEWCKKSSCDVGGRLNFHDIERLVMRSCAESGEVIIRLVNQQFGYSGVPLALEVIESDLLVDDYNGTAENGNEIRMGVEVDKWSRPVAYYFYAGMRHPGDYLFSSHTVVTSRYKRIPADEIIHLYTVDRPGQTRGVTWFSSSVERLHHLSGYEQAELISKRVAASLMGFITSPEGELIGDGVYDDERVTTFEPGVFKYLAPGESVSVPAINNDQSATYADYIRASLRAFSAGLGCSAESVMNDYSQSNYSSSRLALQNERDVWRQLQSWLIDNFNKIVYYRWLDMAVLSGVLNLPRYELDPSFYHDCRFIPRSWGYIDPTKEVDAYKEALRAGFVTKSQIIAENGSDLQEVYNQLSAEHELAESLELQFDTDVPMPIAVQQYAAPIAADTEDEVDDIEDNDIEDNDVEEDDMEESSAKSIYKRVPERYSHINFRPPVGARSEAKRGLAWRREFGRGGTAVGVARARDIQNGVELSPDTLRRMRSFFARHEVDKQATGFSPGEDGFPSNGRIAWALWGGDPGQTWANKVVNQMNVADEEDN